MTESDGRKVSSGQGFLWPPGSRLDWAFVDASRRRRNRRVRTLALPYAVVSGLFGVSFLQDGRDQGVGLAITGTFVLLLLIATPSWGLPYLWEIWRDQHDLDAGREAFRCRYGVDPLNVHPRQGGDR